MEYSIFHPENENIRNRPKSMMAHSEVEFGLSRFQFHALLRTIEGSPLYHISWYITFNLARLIPSHWHSSRSRDQPALSILVCTSLYCHHRQGHSLFQICEQWVFQKMLQRTFQLKSHARVLFCCFNRNQRILGICKGSLRCPPEYVLLYREFGGNLWERDSQNRLATEVFFMKRKTQGNLCKHLIDWFHGTMVW